MKPSESPAQKSFFQETASDYSSLFGGRLSGATHSFRTRARLAAELTAGLSGAFLDCACGSGEVTASVLASGSYGTAVISDFSPAMLELARGTIPSSAAGQLTWVESDCFALLGATEPGSLDTIVCAGLIAHTGRLGELLSLSAAALRQGGHLLFQSTLAEHGGVAFHRLVTAKRYQRNHGYSISYQTSSEIRAAAAKAGLRERAFRRYTLFVPFMDRIAPRVNHTLERAAEGIAGKLGSEGLWLFGK